MSEMNKSALLDIVTDLNPKSKKYSTWLQECYSIIEVLHINILSYVFSKDEMKQNYFEGIKTFFDKIVEGFDKKDDLLNEMNIVIEKQNKCLQKVDNLCIKDFCKTAVEFIESLLREIYYEQNKFYYYDDRDKLTFGILLDSNKNMYKGYFNKDFLDGLMYYLSYEINEKGEKVGLDLRNKMKHVNIMFDEDYNQVLFMRMSLILTTLINELYIKSI